MYLSEYSFTDSFYGELFSARLEFSRLIGASNSIGEREGKVN